MAVQATRRTKSWVKNAGFGTACHLQGGFGC
jgi:hypothetical protein